ncbi:hypothetical protein, partial [Selenomonas sp.]|uniref:hypothetical protein n=1 Tax=Selenomonas sp. TaxID=2053611 RepID=UPI002A82D3A0
MRSIVTSFRMSQTIHFMLKENAPLVNDDTQKKAAARFRTAASKGCSLSALDRGTEVELCDDGAVTLNVLLVEVAE